MLTDVLRRWRLRRAVRPLQRAIAEFDWGTWNPDVCESALCEEPTAWRWRHDTGALFDRYLCSAHHESAVAYRLDPDSSEHPECEGYWAEPYVSDGVGERPVTWSY